MSEKLITVLIGIHNQHKMIGVIPIILSRMWGLRDEYNGFWIR
jgi:hypothetical protein